MELRYVLKDCRPLERKAFQNAIRESRKSLYDFVSYDPTATDWLGAHEFEFWINDIYIMVRLSGTDSMIHLFKCNEVLDIVRGMDGINEVVFREAPRISSDDELLTERHEQQRRNRRYDEVDTD